MQVLGVTGAPEWYAVVGDGCLRWRLLVMRPECMHAPRVDVKEQIHTSQASVSHVQQTMVLQFHVFACRQAIR